MVVLLNSIYRCNIQLTINHLQYVKNKPFTETNAIIKPLAIHKPTWAIKSSYHHNLSIMNAITTNKSASNDETAVDDYYASSRFSKDPRTKQCIILPVRMYSHLSFLPTNNKNNNNTFLFFHSENQGMFGKWM